MLYRLEKHLLFGIADFSPSKDYLSETKNNACITNSKNRASRLEFLNRFAKNHL